MLLIGIILYICLSTLQNFVPLYMKLCIMYRFIVTCFLLIGLPSCSKEKSRKWLVVDLFVKNELTQLSVKTRVELQYVEPAFAFGSVTKKVDLGYTSEDGQMKIEQEVSRRAGGFILNLYAPGYTCPTYEVLPAHIEKGFTMKKKNVKHIYLKPRYYYRLESIKNINCFNSQDSMWINGSSYAYAGCTDQSYQVFGELPICLETPNFHLDLKIKRNEVITYESRDFILSHGITTDIKIEY